jgi:hypothetical protein
LGLRDDRGCGREATKDPGSESTYADPIPHPAFSEAVSTQVPPEWRRLSGTGKPRHQDQSVWLALSNSNFDVRAEYSSL